MKTNNSQTIGHACVAPAQENARAKSNRVDEQRSDEGIKRAAESIVDFVASSGGYFYTNGTTYAPQND